MQRGMQNHLTIAARITTLVLPMAVLLTTKVLYVRCVRAIFTEKRVLVFYVPMP